MFRGASAESIPQTVCVPAKDESLQMTYQATALNDLQLTPLSRTATENGYATAILSSRLAIQNLRQAARQLMPHYDPMLDPQFFVTSLKKEWTPRVIVIKRGADLVGIVYAKERTGCGVPIGILGIDNTLNTSLVSREVNHQQILSFAAETLLRRRRTWSVQLKLPSGVPEVSAFTGLLSSPSIDVQFSSSNAHHAHFPLPSTYDEFLNRLGSTSRRNFRYYRRRFESDGHRYVTDIPMNVLRSAAFDLKKKCGLPLRTEGLQRLLNMVATTDTPLAVGLQQANGEWLSVAAGCYRPGQAVLFFQVNSDQHFTRSSLSVVLRGYLIQTLIEAGCPEFVFWGGTVPPLSRYATHPAITDVHLDKRVYGWRAVRFLSRMVGPSLPKQFRAYARRIAPSRLRPESPDCAG